MTIFRLAPVSLSRTHCLTGHRRTHPLHNAPCALLRSGALLKHNSFLGPCYFRSRRKSHKINFLWYDETPSRVATTAAPCPIGWPRSAAPGYDLIQHPCLARASLLLLLMRLFIIAGVWKIIPLSCHILELLTGEYLADDLRQNLWPIRVLRRRRNAGRYGFFFHPSPNRLRIIKC